eukprot:264473-Pelagomonas_calceolata.AAC.1
MLLRLTRSPAILFTRTLRPLCPQQGIYRAAAATAANTPLVVVLLLLQFMDGCVRGSGGCGVEGGGVEGRGLMQRIPRPRRGAAGVRRGQHDVGGG